MIARGVQQLQQRERISSGLTSMIREHNRTASTAAPPASSPSSSSSAPIVAVAVQKDHLLGICSATAAATATVVTDPHELTEEEVWANQESHHHLLLLRAAADQEHQEQQHVRLLSKWRMQFPAAPPTNIPVWSRREDEGSSSSGSSSDEESEEEENCQSPIDLPPHMMVAQARMRSLRSSVAFSVMEGAGRTLKGWDLRRVRRAVWEQTGFL